MEQDSISFSVQIKTRDLFRFKMYHGYHSASGIFGLLLTLFAAIMLMAEFANMQMQSRVVLFLIIIWFVCVDPLQFWLHSRGAARRNPVYQKPLQYRLDSAGITVSQDETEQTMSWEQVVKMVETKKQFIIYSSKLHAFIFPKEEVGADSDRLRDVLQTYARGIKSKGFQKGRKQQ